MMLLGHDGGEEDLRDPFDGGGRSIHLGFSCSSSHLPSAMAAQRLRAGGMQEAGIFESSAGVRHDHLEGPVSAVTIATHSLGGPAAFGGMGGRGRSRIDFASVDVEPLQSQFRELLLENSNLRQIAQDVAFEREHFCKMSDDANAQLIKYRLTAHNLQAQMLHYSMLREGQPPLTRDATGRSRSRHIRSGEESKLTVDQNSAEESSMEGGYFPQDLEERQRLTSPLISPHLEAPERLGHHEMQPRAPQALGDAIEQGSSTHHCLDSDSYANFEAEFGFP